MCEDFIIYDEWDDFPLREIPLIELGDSEGELTVVSFPDHKENPFYKLCKEVKDELET